MFYIVKKSEAAVRQIASNKIARNYITKAISPRVSFALTEATDYYEMETTQYNRIYFVTEGTLVLTIGGQQVTLEKEDVCFLEKNTPYEMKGSFKAVVINEPAFGA